MSMNGKISIAIGLLVCILTQGARGECLDAGIEAAFRRQDVGELQRIVNENLNKAKLSSADAELLGISTYRAATILSRNHKNDEIKVLLERTADKIEPVWLTEKRTDVAAVLSMIYGFQIGMSPLRGVILGKKTQEMLEDAENMGQVSPRLHLAEALSRFYRPEFLGGGPSKASSEFKLAIAGYGENSANKGVCWGRSDAVLGLARAKLKLNENAAAIALIDEVITKDVQNPVAHWMLDDLRKAGTVTK